MTTSSTNPPDPKDPTTRRFCGSCGTQLRIGAKFCPGCGATVSDDEPGDALSRDTGSGLGPDPTKAISGAVASVTPSSGEKLRARTPRLKSGLLSTVKALYWLLTVFLAFAIALCIKILFFEEHDRQYLFNTAAGLITLLTILSAATVLRFRSRWMTARLITVHCVLLAIGLFGTITSDRQLRSSRQTSAALSPDSSQQLSSQGSAAVPKDATTQERQFWAYRMDNCRPLVQDAGEVRHQERMLLIIETAVVKEYNVRGSDSARMKAASALSTISEARATASKMRRKFGSENFDKVRPDWFADTLHKYASTQVKYAKITEERARVLKEYSESGDASLLVGLENINKELSANADNALKFEKGFADLCFSPPEKRP